MKKQTVKMTESELLEIYLEKLCILKSAYCNGDLSDKFINKLTCNAHIMRQMMANEAGVCLNDFKFQNYMKNEVLSIKKLKEDSNL